MTEERKNEIRKLIKKLRRKTYYAEHREELRAKAKACYAETRAKFLTNALTIKVKNV